MSPSDTDEAHLRELCSRVDVFCDSKNVVTASSSTGTAGFLQLTEDYLRQSQEYGVFFEHLPGSENPADVLTKQVPRAAESRKRLAALMSPP